LAVLIATAVAMITSVPTSEPREQTAGETTAPSAAPSTIPQADGVTVPDVGGLSAMEARTLLNRMGLVVVDAEPTTGTPGKVVSTDPAANEIVDPATLVVLYVGASADRIEGGK
jgi:hypothetical protein